MNQLLLTVCSILMLTFICPGSAQANQDIQVYLNYDRLNLEQAPVIENGRTLVPFRNIFEALGVEVQWDGSSQTVSGQYENGFVISSFSFQIGANQAYLKGERISMDTPAKIINNKTMVPVRAIVEWTRNSIYWDSTERKVYVFKAEITDPGYATSYFVDLDLRNKGLQDITPLQTVVADFLADTLYLDNNNITDISPLLEYLPPEANLTLYLGGNNIETLPVADYSGISILSLENNHISDITPLIASPRFSIVDLRNNPVPAEQVQLLRTRMAEWYSDSKVYF